MLRNADCPAPFAILPAVAGCARRPDHSACKGEDGATLVETAVVMPVFLLLIFGFVNFALIMFGLCNLTYATRFAVRYACLHSSTSMSPVTVPALTTIINPFIFQYPANTYTTALTYGTTNVVGGRATVTITVTYTLNIPFIPSSPLSFTSGATGVITE